MVRALARTAFDKVHGPLLESAADEHLPEPVKLTIRSVVQDGARLSGSIVIDELLAPARVFLNGGPERVRDGRCRNTIRCRRGRGRRSRGSRSPGR